MSNERHITPPCTSHQIAKTKRLFTHVAVSVSDQTRQVMLIVALIRLILTSPVRLNRPNLPCAFVSSLTISISAASQHPHSTTPRHGVAESRRGQRQQTHTQAQKGRTVHTHHCLCVTTADTLIGRQNLHRTARRQADPSLKSEGQTRKKKYKNTNASPQSRIDALCRER